MSDLNDLSGVSGTPLTEAQIDGILAQIDLDLLNLMRDGKLAALKYSVPGGAAGRSADRGENLRALLEARDYYRKLRETLPAWETSVGTDALRTRE